MLFFLSTTSSPLGIENRIDNYERSELPVLGAFLKRNNKVCVCVCVFLFLFISVKRAHEVYVVTSNPSGEGTGAREYTS